MTKPIPAWFRHIRQTDFGPKTGNCFQACVAMVTGLNLEDVPHFATMPDWSQVFSDWCVSKGFNWYCVSRRATLDVPKEDRTSGFANQEAQAVIISGNSPRFAGVLHSVVTINGLFFDPHPSDEGIAEWLDIIVITKPFTP